MKVVSLFSGCGGSSLGYKMAGAEVLCAVEFIKSAADCYAANHTDTHVIVRDIRDIQGAEILGITGLRKGELDILDGSPPCASFSAVGKREKLWGKVKQYSNTKQRVDDLFFEYMRIVEELKPKIAIAENVKGLTQGKSKAILQQILDEFSKIGYTPNFKVLKACDFGAPQVRERVIIVATRNDITTSAFIYPEPTHEKEQYISVREAISDINNSAEEIEVLLAAGKKYANMQKWDEIPSPGMYHPVRFNVGKNRWDYPSYAITYTDSKLSAAGLCHPFEKRRHTIAEMKRLMGFPDSYVLLGTWQEQVERLGRSVCPQVICAVARQVKKVLEESNDRTT